MAFNNPIIIQEMKNIHPFITLSVSIAVLLLMTAGSQPKDSKALDIVSRHTILYTTPPRNIPAPYSTDAPLLGNGSMSVALSGKPEKQVFYVCRNDFWRLKSAIDESFPALLGKIEVSIPGLTDASYRVEQSLADATTIATFRKGEQTVQYKAYTAATKDLFIVELTLQGTGTLQGTVRLEQRGKQETREDARWDKDFPCEMKTERTADGTLYLTRAFTEEVDIPTQAALALRVFGNQTDNSNRTSGVTGIIGATATTGTTGKETTFTLKPGVTIRLVCATSSNFQSKDCLQQALKQVTSCRPRALAKVRQEHLLWWKNYWEQSYVSIPDPVIEKHYYISLYGMGACSRTPDFAPSIFGSWITQEVPWWNGDYHLNYNHMAPYYALYSANRLEQALPYTHSMLAQIDRGKYYSAKVCGIKDGILLPVGAGPLGIETTRRTPFMDKHMADWITSGNVEDEGVFWGQKSNTAYAVTNMSMHFYRTWDKEYAALAYPFVKAVATFWENYLTREDYQASESNVTNKVYQTPEDYRYVIYNDAIHEGTVGTMNPILSLGLVRMVMQTAIDMSQYLGIDADKRPQWNEKRTHLSDYPVQVRNGRKVFRYTERGTDWWENNSLGIQHIYPAGQIGLDSDPELITLSLNTINEMYRWEDYNGSNSFYPAAVRIGYSPDTLLTKLHAYALHTYPNGFQKGNPHGIENFSTTPNTINEMLCMGHQNIIRLFPVWPRHLDASFTKVRVEGAFLVSGELKRGEVKPFTIQSEQGRPLTLLNPWPDRRVKITPSKGKIDYTDGDRITIATKAGVAYQFEPI